MFKVITGGRSFREHVLLRDGQSVLLRMASRDDLPSLEALVARTSAHSLRLRFMGAMAHVPAAMLAQMCGEDPRECACLLAVAGEGEEARVVGFGNYVGIGARRTAEVAFLVEDAWQGRGISTLLLERLAGIAAGAGFVAFEAEVLFENQAMLNVFRDSGFEARQALEGGTYHLEFPVGGAAALRERGELRERVAAAASVARLLRPRAVAVVGASRRRGSVGGRIFANLLRNDFTGAAYPVNRRGEPVSGVRGYPSVGELPEPPDLVVIAVPAEQVVGVAEQSLACGARSLVVVTAGFAEEGAEGAQRQARLLELVRSGGARLVGPNCLGLLNTDPAVRLNASLAPGLPPVGRVGFFSHSAALGIVILQHAAERGLGFSSFVSAGNRADVSGNDLLQYWEEDASTDLAMLYLETFGNPRRFARVARRVSRKKPVLCVKSARSRAGHTAAAAHIGARPLEDVDVEALFRQAGVVRLDTLEELFDVAVLLAHQPLPAGNRVAVLCNSGGVATITADACEAHALLPQRVVDLGPLAGPEDYREHLERALVDPETDAAIVIFLCVGDCTPELIGRGIRRGVLAAERRGVAKPVLLCMMGASGLVEVSAGAARTTVFPSYRFPESAARALARVVEVAVDRRRPAGRLVWHEDVDAAGARVLLERLAAQAGSDSMTLGAGETEDLLARFGIPRRSGPPSATVAVRAHPDFGPLIVLTGPSGHTGQRITPLADQDVEDLLAAAAMVGGGGEAELLGRLSQLVEEMPWLERLEARTVPAAHGSAALDEVRSSFRIPAEWRR